MTQHLTLTAVLLAGISSVAMAAEQVGTRVVVILDTSGSFAKQAPAAGEKIVQLLDDWSKQRVQRGNHPQDELRLIALDASPDVVYRTTLSDINKTGPAGWRAIVGARSGYAGCTDVEAGFRKAVELFQAAPAAAANYLIVASDLIDEPIDPRSVGRGRLRCLPPRPTPPAGMPWQELARLQVKGFATWLPTTQAIVWKKALADNGLSEVLHVFDNFESGIQNLPTPERPKPASIAPLIPVGELGSTAAKPGSAIGSYVLWAALIGSLAIGLFAGVGFWRRRQLQANAATSTPVPTVGPNGAAGRPVTGAIAPLRLDPRAQG